MILNKMTLLLALRYKVTSFALLILGYGNVFETLGLVSKIDTEIIVYLCHVESLVHG